MDIQAEINRRTAERIGSILLGRIALEVENDLLKARLQALEAEEGSQGGSNAGPGKDAAIA